MVVDGWIPTQAHQGTETNRAAVFLSGGAPEAGRPRGYDRVKALTADRARLEAENERPSMRGRLHELIPKLSRVKYKFA